MNPRETEIAINEFETRMITSERRGLNNDMLVACERKEEGNARKRAAMHARCLNKSIKRVVVPTFALKKKDSR